MEILDNLLYTEDHEWIRVEGEIAYIGVTDYAQSQLGDIVFVEVETEGETLNKKEAFGTIEAVKTVSDVFMPISGEILEFNEQLEGSPDLINKEPYGDGWIVKIKFNDASELEALLNATKYKEIAGE